MLAIMKWEKKEQDLLARGITPVTINQPQHLRNWYYAHGRSLNLDNGECIFGERIQAATYRLQETIETVAQGTFELDREKDELTYTFQNFEHLCLTRGKSVILYNLVEITRYYL